MLVLELGIEGGVIIARMNASRFMSLGGRRRDQVRDRQHVLRLPARAIVEQLVENVLSPEANDLERFSQPIAVALLPQPLCITPTSPLWISTEPDGRGWNRRADRDRQILWTGDAADQDAEDIIESIAACL